METACNRLLRAIRAACESCPDLLVRALQQGNGAIRKANILHEIPKTTVLTAKFRGTNEKGIQRKRKGVLPKQDEKLAAITQN